MIDEISNEEILDAIELLIFLDERAAAKESARQAAAALSAMPALRNLYEINYDVDNEYPYVWYNLLNIVPPEIQWVLEALEIRGAELLQLDNFRERERRKEIIRDKKALVTYGSNVLRQLNPVAATVYRRSGRWFVWKGYSVAAADDWQRKNLQSRSYFLKKFGITKKQFDNFNLEVAADFENQYTIYPVYSYQAVAAAVEKMK